MNRLENPDKIQELLDQFGRLRFLLKNIYKISLSDIFYIAVDSNLMKVEIFTPNEILHFRARGMKNVLKPSEKDFRNLQISQDTALCRDIIEIINYFGE